MTWQPGEPVQTEADRQQWRAWCKARKLELQRERRRRHGRRIDYYPSEEARAAITPHLTPRVGGDLSSVINRLILQGAGSLPE